MLLRWGDVQVTEDLRRVVREVQPAGFVIEPCNVDELDQLVELIRELRALADPHHPALIATRQARLVPEAAAWPEQPATWADHPQAVDAFASELNALGVDLYLDAALGPHTDALVIRMLEHRVCACPGPYRSTSSGELGEHAGAVLDAAPGAVRVGADLAWVARGLREVAGYPGVVLLDDVDEPVPPLAGLEATVDLTTTPRDPEAQLERFGQLVRLQERNTGAQRAMELGTRRVHSLRESLFLDAPPRLSRAVIGSPDHRIIAIGLSERYRES